MATAGSKIGNFNGSTSSCASIILDYSYTQDIEKNATTLTVALKIRRDKTGTTTHKTNTPYSLTVEGTTKSGAYDFDITNISVGKTKTITSITKTLAHNSDGSYKNVSISAKFDVSGTTLGVGTASLSLVLDIIPRATAPTPSVTSVVMGDRITFTLDRASDNFTHDLVYTFGNESGTIGTNLTTAASWAVPNMADEIPDSVSGICTITCATYSADKLIGTKNVTITVKVPADVVPTLSLAVSEAVDDVATKLGVYVKGLSKLKIVATGAGVYGSKVVAYAIKANNATYTTRQVTTDILSSAGQMDVTAQITDSRGRINTKTTTITVSDYTKPAVSAFRIDRTTGANATAYIKASVTDLKGNTPNYTLEYKKTSEDAYKAYIVSDTAASIEKSVTLTDVSPDYHYNFKLTVSDQFNSTTVLYDIGTEFTLIDFNASGKGMAIGKVSENPEALEIALPLKFDGTTLVDLIYPVGSIYMSVNNTNPSTLFGGTWTAWGAGRVPVGVDTTQTDFNTVEKTGGESKHTLSVQELPSHAHGTRYKGFTLTGNKNGFMVLRRNDSDDSYDGTDSDAAMNTGGGQAHNNLQPYITCYMWKRTA